MKSAALCVLLSVSCAAALAAPPTVTLASMARWPIVCDARATPAERTAATEFQTLYRGATGVTLPIAAAGGAAGSAIYVGPDAVRRSGRAMPSAALGEEGLRIRVDRDAVCIDGGRPRGTLYGVHEFFEELCGVRYLTFDHTYFPPRAASAPIPVGSRTFVPRFVFRWSYYGETSRRPAFAARLHTNTVSTDPALGGKTGYQLVYHNVASLVPPSVYGKVHPEYYALVKGKRDSEFAEGGGPQLCLTNPAVRDIVVGAIRKQIEENPAQRSFHIAQMDTSRYCTCPNCAALDRRERSHSATMIAFVNAVAERIEKPYPNALISTFAYQYTRKPPRTIRPRHNVMIQLCSIECCDIHAVDDPHCALNREFCRDMQVWNSKCDRLFIWHYNTNFGCYMLPFPNLRAIGGSVKYFADHSGRGVFMQAAGNGFSTEMSDLRNYVMSRCLWKPGRDSWREAMEFCRLHYAESAAPIMAYLTYYHDLMAKAGMHATCFASDTGLCLTADTTQRIMGYFRQAMALARSEDVRDRVEKASLCAYRAALVGGVASRYAYRDGYFYSRPTWIGPDLPATYRAVCAKYGVTHESEVTSLQAFLASPAASVSTPAAWPAVRLENNLWRVVLVPEVNAKIVEMTYKPTRRAIVVGRRPFHRWRFEEWAREGDGPSPKTVLAYTVVRSTPASVVLSAAAADGTRFVRTITLTGKAVRFSTGITAGTSRTVEMLVHPEYDIPTPTADPNTLRAYGKVDGKWTWINRDWLTAYPEPSQEAAMRRGLAGGVLAFYSYRDRYGVEQRFAPGDFREASFRPWPSRSHVNLEMAPRKASLRSGETTRYCFEVRYLAEPPTVR